MPQTIPSELTDALRTTPITATLAICDFVSNSIPQSNIYSDKQYQTLLEASAYLTLAIEDKLITNVRTTPPQISGSNEEDSWRILQFVEYLQQELRIKEALAQYEMMREEARTRIGIGPRIDITSADIERLQQLINEARAFIQETSTLSEEHRSRLLSRLEALQAELHKRVSNFDKFWAFVGDATSAIAKAGQAAEPFLRTIQSFTHVIALAQFRSEGLPGDAPLPELLQKPLDKEFGD